MNALTFFCKAILERKVIRFYYGGGYRFAEPHCYGVSKGCVVAKRGHEMHRLLFVAGFLICTASLDAEQMAGLAAAQELPPGVKTVLLGDRDEAEAASGVLHCTVKNPLKEPFTLSAGTTEFTWVVEIDPDWWGKAGLRIVVDGPGFKDEVTGTHCNEYAVCMGEPCQKQYGATITRTDKKPFPAGKYTLSIWGEGRSVVKTLTIK
jgi:hypothetical protein